MVRNTDIGNHFIYKRDNHRDRTSSVNFYYKNDPSDNRILECAITAEADYIVTGDKNHLLPLKRYKNIRILSPSEFLRL